jgi:benzoyl-CoA oxygenase/reductase BoxA protein
LALTVKRVTVDHAGNAVLGIASNYICDLKKGDQVKVIGPFGATFLMPDDPGAHLLMICTGTGSAPMRAMTERRRRRRAANDGQLMLFFGARTQQELPYFGPLTSLPRDFIETHLAFSRSPGEPKRYVQDLMWAQRVSVARLLSSPATHIYVCGLKGMEDGVMDTLRRTAEEHGLSWDSLWPRLKSEGRLHLETY